MSSPNHHRILSRLSIRLLMSCAILSVQAQAANTVDLRCEYETNPLGVDTRKPYLSWRMESAAPGQKQTAYQILVADSPDKLKEGLADLWDSGKVESDRSQHVPYAGKPLSSGMACYWTVRVWAKDGEAGDWSRPGLWTMALDEMVPASSSSSPAASWTAQWITAPASSGPAMSNGDVKITKATYRTLDGKVEQAATSRVTPQFRKDFKLAAAPSSAYVTVHSPAYFEIYVNGKKVGMDVLSPAVSDHKKETFALTYDVQPLLKDGENCLGLWLGPGWAENMVARAQLVAMVNGKPLIIGTDGSWKYRPSGRYRIGQNKWGDFGGELIDAREILPNWCQPDLSTESWASAVAAQPTFGPVRRQPCPPNRLGDPISPVSVTDIGEGLYEIDFGKALTGWFRMEMPPLKSGATVTLTFADTKSELSKRLAKMGTAAYQHFRQISTFVSGGNAGEVFEHKFNYAAFRYVIVKGLPGPPDKEDAVARLVDSDLQIVGSFECSNELLNRIHAVNKWTQRCLNLGGYYVDCPHRERMGYGDGQVAAEGFLTGFRADGFYRKWLTDWRGVQQADGSLKNTAPWGKGGGGPGWGGLLSAIAWRHYLYYGDRRIVEENYDAIRRYVDALEEVSRANRDILTGKTGKFSFIGDWVAPGRGMDSKEQPTHRARELFNNCYRLNQMGILVNMADVLGKTDDVAAYTKLLAEIRPKVHEAFYDPAAGFYVSDEQAHYVMPLMTGVVPEVLRPTVLGKLEQNILVKNGGHLDTGMLGTYFMMEYLREIGRSDLAFTMFNQKSYPGWGYMLEEGGTTFWEQWNGYWSHLHSCFTSPGNWLYQGLAGIQADPHAPGFKNVIVKPELVGDLTWVKSHYDSNYGRVVSNWKLEGKTLTMEVSIPPNSTGTVYVPTHDAAECLVNGKRFSKQDGVSLLREEDERLVLRVESGRYTIRAVR